MCYNKSRKESTVTKKEKKSMKCNICPRKCNVDRDISTGYCRSSNEIKIARAALHYWEEPCISGSNGSGTVFFCGCNLGCVFCQNRKISRGKGGYVVTKEELADIFIELQNKNAHNINLVTPTHFSPHIIPSTEIARKKGLKIPIVYNCGGIESVEALKTLQNKIQIYLPDFKYWDNFYAKKYSYFENYSETVKKAIEEMVKQVGKIEFDENGIMKKGVIVRHLALPYLEEDSKKIIEYLYKTYKNDIYISIMSQYTPPKNIIYEELKYPVRDYQYREIVEFALSLGIKNAYIQDGESVGESFIPDFS